MYRINGGFVAQLVNTLEKEGLDSDSLCRQAGIDPALLGLPDSFMRRADVYRLMALAQVESGDPDIGLRAYRHFLPGGFQLVGYAMMSSPNLKSALDALVRYQPLLGTGARVGVSRDERGTCIWGIDDLQAEAKPRAFEDACLAALLGLCRWLTGGSLPGLHAVEFTYPEPLDITEHQRLFDCTLCFGAQRNGIVFDQEALLRPLSTANEALALLHGRFAEHRMNQLREASYGERTRSWLMEHISFGRCDMASAAKGLKVGERVLQRGLAREGATFRDVLDDARRQLADYYLRNTPYSLAQIGELLGFREPSSFHKASLRWFGMPPGRYRLLLSATESLPRSTPRRRSRTSDSAHETNDQRVDDIDEEAADQGDDDERLVRRTVPLGDRGHVDDGRGGGAQGDAAEAGGDHAGFVVASQAAEHQQHGIEDRQQHLQRQNSEDENQHAAQLP